MDDILKRRTKKSRCLVGVRSRLLITILEAVVLPLSRGPALFSRNTSSRLVSSRLGVVPKGHWAYGITEKNPQRIQPIEVAACAQGRMARTPRVAAKRMETGPQSESASLARANERRSPGSASHLRPVQHAAGPPRADTNRLPPRGNYEYRGSRARPDSREVSDKKPRLNANARGGRSCNSLIIGRL